MLPDQNIILKDVSSEGGILNMTQQQDGRTDIRRKDRLVQDEDWIKDMLRFEPYCTVATAVNNQPFIRPSAFYYSEVDNAIYIHGAQRGRGFDNLKVNNNVCLCVYVTGKMRGHVRAFDFFLEQAGVIVFGQAFVVEDNQKKQEVMQALFEKHVPQLIPFEDYEPASQSEIDQTTVYRIDIEAWSGKMKWTDEEPSFYFDYEDVRGNNRPKLPWSGDEFSNPLTQEWKRSRSTK